MCSWLKAGLKVLGQESHFYRRLTRHGRGEGEPSLESRLLA